MIARFHNLCRGNIAADAGWNLKRLSGISDPMPYSIRLPVPKTYRPRKMKRWNHDWAREDRVSLWWSCRHNPVDICACSPSIKRWFDQTSRAAEVVK